MYREQTQSRLRLHAVLSDVLRFVFQCKAEPLQVKTHHTKNARDDSTRLLRRFRARSREILLQRQLRVWSLEESVVRRGRGGTSG